MTKLDINTLFLVTIYVEAILGILLLFAWAQNLSVRAVAWWGGAHLLRATSITLFGLYDKASNIFSIELSNAVLLMSFAAMWAGSRKFDGRSASMTSLFAGAAIWLVAVRFPIIADSATARTALSSGIITTYIWAAAYELWRGRDEPLVSRIPAFCMFFAYGCIFLLNTPIASYLPWIAQAEIGSIWLAVLSFESLLFTIAVAFIMLAMAKERIEHSHKTAAMVDSLTGIANRRGFLMECEEIGRRRTGRAEVGQGETCAVLLLDIDHFKSVNDRFGHAIGDRVLQVFARTTTENIRSTDLFGRLGGEEFGVLLNAVGRERALVTAERIRTAFLEAAGEVDGQSVGGTVSIGIALTDDRRLDMASLLAQADSALYRAKERGRNRVEVAMAPQIRRRDADYDIPQFSERTPASA